MSLNSPPSVSEKPRNGRERSRIDVTNPTNWSKGGKSVGNTGLVSQAPIFHPLILRLEDEDIQIGKSGLPPSSISKCRNRNRIQEPPKDTLGVSGASGDNRSGFSTPIEESYSIRNRISQPPRRSFSRQSRTLGGIRDDNLNKTIQDERRRVSSLEKEKELALLNWKLAELKVEKTAGFPTNTSLVNGKTLEESNIRHIIIQVSKLTIPFIKPYSDLNYAQYQTFVRECEYVFRTRHTTYRKEVEKVLYGIGELEGTLSTTWYRYKEKFGWLDIGLDAFKTFLLDDLFSPEIPLRDAYKKYQEAKQRLRQTVHALIRYL